MPGRQFVDRQVDGPFASWEHVHRFVPIDDERSELLDHIEYSLPAGGLTDFVGEGPAGKTLSRLFRFRHERTRLDLGRHAEWADRPRLKVAIAGASGLIGSHLADYLTTAGHRVVRLVRNKEAGPDEIPWDPSTGALDHGALEGVDAVVNLAGVSLNGIWTSGRKKAILDSRVQATRTLAEAMARMDSPPSVFISVSAVGAYGSRGGEASPSRRSSGEGFLADVCRAWEEAATRPTAAGVRLVTAALRHRRQRGRRRCSPRCSRRSRPGSAPGSVTATSTGRGSTSTTCSAALEWALHDEELEGVVNVTAPEPVTNREFTKTLGRVLHRPAALAAPAFVLRHGLGGMGDEMLLASQRAMPAALKARGFRFAFPTLEGALRYELGRQLSRGRRGAGLSTRRLPRGRRRR